MLNTDALAHLGATLEKYGLIRPDAVDAIRLLLLTGARPAEVFGDSAKEWRSFYRSWQRSPARGFI